MSFVDSTIQLPTTLITRDAPGEKVSESEDNPKRLVSVPNCYTVGRCRGHGGIFKVVDVACKFGNRIAPPRSRAPTLPEGEYLNRKINHEGRVSVSEVYSRRVCLRRMLATYRECLRK